MEKNTVKMQIAEYLLSSSTGLTTTECLSLFHTTELRKIMSDLRKEGFVIRTENETHFINGNKGKHKRYYIDDKQ